MKYLWPVVIVGLVATATVQAQPLPPPCAQCGTTIFTFGNSVGNGNGADVTEDTLLTYSIPAGTLKGNGDRIRIYANGNFASSTDTKAARVRLNNTAILQAANGATASTTSWDIYMEVMKIGLNQQIGASYALVTNGAVVVGGGGALAMTDTAAIVLTVTGQNSTTAAANSITVKYLAIEYLP